jgi:hypothetical protein
MAVRPEWCFARIASTLTFCVSTTQPTKVSLVLNPPRVPSSVVALTVVAAIAACAIFVGGLGPAVLGSFGGWRLVVAGGLVLITALAALWVIQHRRDHTLW